MRIVKGKRTWRIFDSHCMGIIKYTPIDDDTAEVHGFGRIFNDSIKEGDVLWIKMKGGGIGELIVDSITYEDSYRKIWHCVVKLGNYVDKKYL